LKVAIIGAGLAGLSCAIELEKNNIAPTIFETKSFIGDIETHITASLNMRDRPIRDWVKYCDEVFGIKLTPVNTIKTITHHLPKKTTVVRGKNLGYFFKRGNEPDSVIAQLRSQLKTSEIRLSENCDYEELAKEYDYVVIANGECNFTKELGCWQERVSGWVRGAVVTGSFNPNEIIMWMDRKYSNKGYAYLTPFSANKASIVLYVPYISEQEIDHYWELFLYSENIRYTILEEFKKLHHSGNVYPHRYENIFLAGTSGGAIDSFLGFGQVDSITHGVNAGKAIANGVDYEELIKKTVQSTTDIWEIRKAFDRASNMDYDKMFSAIGTLGVKQLIYNTPINFFKLTAFFIKLQKRL